MVDLVTRGADDDDADSVFEVSMNAATINVHDLFPHALVFCSKLLVSSLHRGYLDRSSGQHRC